MFFFKKKKKKNLNIHETTIISPSARVSNDSSLGRHCYVGNYSDITKTKIGHYVSIANNVSVASGEHYLERISTNSIFYARPYAELTRGDCTIGSDTWIGVDAIVRRGVTIGVGAVIGANSFVNSDVPNFGIVVGSPARLIGFRFPDDEQELILKSEWWELDLEQAKLAISNLEQELESLRQSR